MFIIVQFFTETQRKILQGRVKLQAEVDGFFILFYIKRRFFFTLFGCFWFFNLRQKHQRATGRCRGSRCLKMCAASESNVQNPLRNSDMHQIHLPILILPTKQKSGTGNTFLVLLDKSPARSSTPLQLGVLHLT